MFGRLANSAEQRSSEAGVMAWKLPALVLPSPDHVHVQTMSGNSKYHNSMQKRTSSRFLLQKMASFC
jgi:hypothetical protein